MMMDVTVVIPTFNRAGLLSRALASVAAQRELPSEVVVVDDGSTDNTAEVVAAFGDGPIPVRYLRQINAGGAAARNLGVEYSTTEWIAFLDSDDEWTPDHLSTLRRAIEATKGAADLYFTDVQRSPSAGGGSLFELAGVGDQQAWELRVDGIAWATARCQPTMLQATVIRRAAFWRVGGLWPALSSRHDTHFFYFALAELPSCAVNGVTVVMSDDADADRLTGGVDNKGERYWRCTVLLYSEVLRRRQDPDERRVARVLLADGYLRCAALAWRERNLRKLVADVSRAAVTDPVALVWRRTVPGRGFPPLRQAWQRLSVRGVAASDAVSDG